MQALARIERSQPTIRTYQAKKLIQIILAFRDHTIEQVNVKSRKTEIVYTRHLLMYFLDTYTRLAQREIGELLCPHNPYDHTTIIHGREKIKDLLCVYDDIKADVNEILERANMMASVAAA